MVALLSALALGVDVGRLYYAQRDLQRQADLAAIDAVRVAEGCLAGVSDYDRAEGEARASLARNGGTPAIAMEVFTGQKVSVDGRWQFQQRGPNEPRDAVQVRLSQTSPARILPLISGNGTRTLRAQAAAMTEWQASLAPTLATANANPEFLRQFYGGGAPPASFTFDPAGLAAAGEANFSIGELIDGEATAGFDLPDLFERTPIPGLLSEVAALLDSTGDTVAAAAVRGFSDAAQASGAALDIVPAEVLGLPTGASREVYENAIANTGQLLNTLAGVINAGTTVAADVNDLIPPEICALVQGLCDASVSATIPQPGQQATFTAAQQNVQTGGEDAVRSAGGLVQFQVRLREPVTGRAMVLPTLAVAFQPHALTHEGTDMDCARLGQERHVVYADARANTFTLGLGQVQDYRPDQPLALLPTEILSLPVADLLAQSGLPALPGLPTGVDLAGQTIRITASAGPVVLGSNALQQLCFEGPPWNTSTQCDGRPAIVGELPPDVIANAVPELVASVRLNVEGIPDGVAGVAVAAALQPVLDSINRLLAPTLNSLAGQVIPVLNGVNLNATGMTVTALSASTTPPQVFAR